MEILIYLSYKQWWPEILLKAHTSRNSMLADIIVIFDNGAISRFHPNSLISTVLPTIWSDIMKLTNWKVLYSRCDFYKPCSFSNQPIYQNISLWCQVSVWRVCRVDCFLMHGCVFPNVHCVLWYILNMTQAAQVSASWVLVLRTTQWRGDLPEGKCQSQVKSCKMIKEPRSGRPRTQARPPRMVKVWEGGQEQTFRSSKVWFDVGGWITGGNN